jgi:lipopolysaccharide transport system permease protein
VTSGAATSTSKQSLSPELVEPVLGGETVLQSTGDAVEIVDYRPSLLETLRDTWRSRHLFGALAISALMAYLMKYRLGPTWIVLQTFMGIVGYTLIFGGGVFDVQTPNDMPYFLFMMVGMMGWLLFQTTLTISARSFLMLRSIVRGIHMPLILVPIAGSSRALLRFGLLFTGYLITISYFYLAEGKLYAQLSPKFLALSAFGLLLCVTFAWGISLWTAPLTAHTLDVRMVIKFAIPFWMFVTPVLYPIDRLHGKTRLIAELNPLSAPVEMAKVGMLGAGSVRLYAAIWSIAVISLVFASGVWFMNRFGPRVVGLRRADEEDEEAMM